MQVLVTLAISYFQKNSFKSRQEETVFFLTGRNVTDYKPYKEEQKLEEKIFSSQPLIVSSARLVLERHQIY